MKKTILIHVFDRNIARNILRTDVLTTLTESEEVGKVVVLTHPRKVAYEREVYTHPKIVVDGYPTPRPSFLELSFWFLARHTIHTNNVRRKIDEIRDRSTGFRWGKYVIALIAFYGTKISFINTFVKATTRKVFNDAMFLSVMEKYRPDLVFLPTIFATNDIRLLKFCKKNAIKTVGMIKSWDNLLGKDPFLIAPDELIVHNELVEKLAVEMHGYPPKKISIVGIPQFDVYADPAYTDSREVFMKEMGLDPQKKLILYAAMGSWIVIYEKEIIQMLAEIVASGELKEDTQLLVRLHPAYKSDDEHLKHIPNIVIDRPGNSNFDQNPWRADFEFEEKDTKRLANTLRHSDVTINSGSTMTIDAAAFDRPIINVAFDAYQTHVPPNRQVKRLLIKEHYLPILNSGGVDVVKSRGELVIALNRFLSNPSYQNEGRQRIVREQCYKMDGKAGERVGRHILANLV